MFVVTIVPMSRGLPLQQFLTAMQKRRWRLMCWRGGDQEHQHNPTHRGHARGLLQQVEQKIKKHQSWSATLKLNLCQYAYFYFKVRFFTIHFICSVFHATTNNPAIKAVYYVQLKLPKCYRTEFDNTRCPRKPFICWITFL